MPTNVKIGFDVDDNASKPIGNINQSLEQTGVSGNIAGLALKAGLAGGAIAAGKAVLDLTAQYAANAKEVQQVAKANQTNTETVSRASYAFQQYGYDLSDVDAILFEVGVKTDDLERGNADLAAAFDRLGLSIDDLKGKDAGAQFDIIIDRVNKLQREGVDLRGTLDTIFGGDDARKVAALAGEYQNLADEASRLGVTLDEDTSESVTKFNTLMRQAEAAATGLANTVAQTAINLTVSVAETLGVLPSEAKTAVDGVIEEFAKSHDSMHGAGSAASNALRAGLKGGLDASVQDAIKARDDIIAQFQNINQEIALAQGGPGSLDRRFDRADSLTGKVPTALGQIGPQIGQRTLEEIIGQNFNPIAARERGIAFPTSASRDALGLAGQSPFGAAYDEFLAEFNRQLAILARIPAEPGTHDGFRGETGPGTSDDVSSPTVEGRSYARFFPQYANDDEGTGYGGGYGGGGGLSGGGGGSGRGGGDIIFNFEFNGVVGEPDEIERRMVQAIQTNAVDIMSAIEAANEEKC